MNKLKKTTDKIPGRYIDSPVSAVAAVVNCRVSQSDSTLNNAIPIYAPGVSKVSNKDTRNSTMILSSTLTQEYWAQRALTAETLLAARTEHHRELRTMTFSEDVKRRREIEALQKTNELKYEKLEKLVMILIALIVFLITFVMYVAIRPSPAQPEHRKTPNFSHYTIPILSPFASVTEHEVSVIGAKTLTCIFGLTVIGVYLGVRHRYPSLGLKTYF